MTLAPGSWPWLLRHEIRLAWRGFGSSRPLVVLAVFLPLWLALHLAFWAVLPDEATPVAPIVFLTLGASVWFMFSLMLAHTIGHSVTAFYDRGDLDLLLASPLPAGSVFIVRGLGVALAAATVWGLLLLPLAHVGLVSGQERLLAIYPGLAALGLLAAACGMGVTMALVRLIGARRARVTAQVLGACVGASLVLAAQAGNLLGRARSDRWLGILRDAAVAGDWLAPGSALWLPLRALQGEPVALALLVLAGTASFALVVALTKRRFLAGSQESMTGPSATADARRRPAARRRFRAGLWRIVLVKEWKLIARDPQLIAHTLLQMLYLLPLLFVWGGRGASDVVFVPTMVLMTASLASALTWITIAAEDAPELVAAAPVPASRFRQWKLAAALLPVWTLLAPLVAWVAASSWRSALVLAVCASLATLAAGLIHLGLARPGERKNLLRRGRGRGNALANLLEFVTMAGWAALAWCLLAAPRWAPLAALPALAGPIAASWLGRSRRRENAPA